MHHSLQETKRTKLPLVDQAEAGAITVPRPYVSAAGSESESDGDAPLFAGPRMPRPRTFKFLTFAERIDKVDIDVHRRPVAAGSREPAEGAQNCLPNCPPSLSFPSCTVPPPPPDIPKPGSPRQIPATLSCLASPGETFFSEGLAKWCELCSGEHFNAFVREAQPLSKSLALVIHNQARGLEQPQPRDRSQSRLFRPPQYEWSGGQCQVFDVARVPSTLCPSSRRRPSSPRSSPAFTSRPVTPSTPSSPSPRCWPGTSRQPSCATSRRRARPPPSSHPPRNPSARRLHHRRSLALASRVPARSVA